MACLAAAALLLPAPPSRAASWLEMNFYLTGPNYTADVPLCDRPLGRIEHRFWEKEHRFWHSNLRILDIENIRESAFRPGHYAAIPRRYCEALALLNDGTRRPIYYSIGEDTGIIGATWGVEWCVVGLDRNWAYNPRCRMARP
jgi:hypothetical protein